jgi:peptidylprolyl isomerase
MQQVKTGDKVKVHYTGTLDDGSVFDSSVGRDPLEFEIGSGQVIRGFEEAVTGMKIGEKKTVLIPAENAYGQSQADLIMEVPLEQVPADLKPEIGMRLEVGGADGQVLRVTVAEITDKVVILDANPPLAGQDLTFALELVSVN